MRFHPVQLSKPTDIAWMRPRQDVIQARVVLGLVLKGPIMSTYFPTQTQLQPYVITLRSLAFKHMTQASTYCT